MLDARSMVLNWWLCQTYVQFIGEENKELQIYLWIYKDKIHMAIQFEIHNPCMQNMVWIS